MGGFWKRLVCSIKESLLELLKKALLDEEKLKTAFCEMEAYLNARPLIFIKTRSTKATLCSRFNCTYVGFRAVETYDPEWQPSGRGPIQ
ncbi:hypothetical protein T08_1022 [Trichinella sp. T8]|nr:hypothetical protein T08_1022 [Trichinella sp. T8]